MKKLLSTMLLCVLLMNLPACRTSSLAAQEKASLDPTSVSESFSETKSLSETTASTEMTTDSKEPVSAETTEKPSAPNKETNNNGAFRTEGEAAHANDSPAQKPTEPIEKITGPISSAKPKEPVATEPKPTEPKPTEPKPTEPKPTETIPAETEPATPTKSYSIQAAMDYGNAYAQSLGFGTNGALSPASASYWPPDEQSDSSIAKYGGQAYLNGRVKQCVDAVYEWMAYQHEQAPDNPNYMISNIPVRIYIEYRYTDTTRGDVYWIYVLS